MSKIAITILLSFGLSTIRYSSESLDKLMSINSLSNVPKYNLSKKVSTYNLYFTKAVCARTTDEILFGGKEDEIYIDVKDHGGVDQSGNPRDDNRLNRVRISEQMHSARGKNNDDRLFRPETKYLLYKVPAGQEKMLIILFREDDTDVDQTIGEVVVKIAADGRVKYDAAYAAQGPRGPYPDAYDSYMFHLTGGNSRYWMFLKVKPE